MKLKLKHIMVTREAFAAVLTLERAVKDFYA